VDTALNVCGAGLIALENTILNVFGGSSFFDETPNKGPRVHEAVVVSALQINDDCLALDGFMRDSGSVNPESLVSHDFTVP
jgi:hypothetical protein